MKAEGTRRIAQIGALGLLYYAASNLGLWFTFEQSHASPIWPAAGVGFLGLILLGWRAWPGIWVGAFAANFTIFLINGVADPGMIIGVSGVIAVGNSLEALAGWFLWNRWCEPTGGPEKPPPNSAELNIFQLAAVALLVSLVSACIGPTTVCTAGLMPWSNYGLIWLIWWFGDASGIFLLTPFVLAWIRPDPVWDLHPLWKHTAAAFALLFAAGWALFVTSSAGNSLAYLLLVPLVWIASRLGPRILTSALILLSALASWATVHGFGPFAFYSAHQSILFLLLFVWVAAITSLDLQAQRLNSLRSAATIRRSEKRFRLAVEYFPGPFVIYNAEKQIQFVNARAAELFGRTTLDGQTAAGWFAPEFRIFYGPSLDQCVREKQPQGLETWLDFEGEQRALVITFVPLLDEQGEVQQILQIGYDITERQRAEEACRRSEALFDAFMRHLPGFAFMKDRNSRYIFLSEQAQEVFGREASECLGKTDFEIWTRPAPEAVEVCRANDRIVLATNRPLQTVEFFPQGDEIRHWLVHKFPIAGPNGSPEFVAGVAVDITDLKRAQRAQEESKRSLRAMTESMSDAVITAEPGGRITAWNKGARAIFGYEPEEILGRSIQTLMPERYRELHQRGLEHFQQTGSGGIVGKTIKEWHGRRKDGTEFPMDISLSTWEVEGRRFFSAIVRDTSERVHAREALRQTEERLQWILQATPITVFTQGPDLRFTWIYNPQLGLSAEEVIGRTVSELLGSENARNTDELARAVIESGEGARRELEITFRGKVIWYDLILEPLRDSQKRIIGVAGVALDITERKTVQSKLEAALKQEEVLRREIHHRVKNNLQIISSLLYLQSTNVTDPKTQEVLRECQVRTRSIGLIHELLYQRSNLTEIDFADYARQLMADLFVAYQALPNQIKAVVHARSIFLNLDTAIPCGLILTELVSNALKHAFPGGRKGRITIDLHRTGDGHLRLRFRDNGIGFPANFNFESAQTMGLRLVRDLTRQLEGTISLRSLQRGASIEIKIADPDSVTVAHPAYANLIH